MGKKRLLYVSGIIASFLILCQCQKKASEEIGEGFVKNGIFHCPYFGMKITIPDSWNPLNKEQIKMISEAGKELVSGNDKNMKSLIEASEFKTVYVFALFKYPLGSSNPINPNLLCIAENIGLFPGIKRGKDYLYHAQNLMKNTPLNINSTNQIQSQSLGGIEFDSTTHVLTIGNKSIKQKMIVTILKKYALSFVMTYDTPEQEQEIEKILSSLNFNSKQE